VLTNAYLSFVLAATTSNRTKYNFTFKLRLSIVYRFSDVSDKTKYDSVRACICGLGRLDFQHLRSFLTLVFIKKGFIQAIT